MVFGTFERPTRKYAVGVAFLRGQGSGRIRHVHGLDQIGREIGSLVVDVKLPVDRTRRQPLAMRAMDTLSCVIPKRPL